MADKRDTTGLGSDNIGRTKLENKQFYCAVQFLTLVPYLVILDPKFKEQI